jgi:hypothetical protein
MVPAWVQDRDDNVVISNQVTVRKLFIISIGSLVLCAGTATCQDTSFAAMQHRGQQAMGVDQYTSIHKFDALDDGGRIELQRDSYDSSGVATIRAHIREIARAFERGDFSTPTFRTREDSSG